jgi:hypothetical protein
MPTDVGYEPVTQALSVGEERTAPESTRDLLKNRHALVR